MKFSIFAYLSLLFFQFVVLQFWRSIPPLSHANGPLVSLTITVFLIVGGLVIYQLIPSHHPKYRFKFKPHLLSISASLLAGILMWYLFVFPNLSIVTHTWGDEDHHFSVTEGLSVYLGQYLKNNPPRDTGYGALRYPSLMHLLFVPFVNPLFNTTNNYFLHRLPLAIPFLALIPLTYLIFFFITRNRPLGLLSALTVATSPILLSFTADKYLDIGHPFLFALASASLYLFATTQNIKWGILTAIAAGLLPLIRDNGMPTSITYGTTLFFLSLLTRQRFLPKLKTGLIFFLISTLPIITYFIIKSLTSTVDTGRLSLKNIPLQNFSIFFKFLPIYLPISTVILAPFSLITKDFRKFIAVLTIFMSLIGQLFIYSLFEPGWMPWTRNYLMFYGQFVVLTAIGTSVLITKFRLAKPLITGFLVGSTIFQVVFSYKELHHNTFFHENETLYRYDLLVNYLSVHMDEFKSANIYLQLPITIPDSFHRSGLEKLSHTLKFIPILFDHKPFDFSNFMPLDATLSRLPPDAQYLIFHYRNYNGFLDILHRYPQTDTSQISKHPELKVLAKFDDPYSNGHTGLVLLKRLSANNAPNNNPSSP